MNNAPQAALERLIRIAQGDSGQCRIVANFLLAWWNAAEYGGFDLTDVWAVDSKIGADMLAVFEQLLRCRRYPDSLGYGAEFETIVANQMRWGSALFACHGACEDTLQCRSNAVRSKRRASRLPLAR